MKTFRFFLLFLSLIFGAGCLVFSRSALSEETVTEEPILTLPALLPGDTPAATIPPCPRATPEPLWVDPVISTTNLLTQTIVVYIGNGEYVSVSGESGVFTQTGDFSSFNTPARVEINLLANTRHNLEVSARVKQVEQNGCIYGGYTLMTTRDRDGNPLVIDQTGYSLFLPYGGQESTPEAP